MHITYVHSPIYFKLSLDCLQYLKQCKRYISSYLCTTNLSFAFHKFLNFFSNIFNLWLVESVDVESADAEGQLYTGISQRYCKFSPRPPEQSKYQINQVTHTFCLPTTYKIYV